MNTPSENDFPIIEAAANGGLRCLEGRTPIHLAAENGKIVMCRFLIEKLNIPVNVKVLGASEESPLLLALKNGNFSTAEFLINKGADIAYSDPKGITALHYATIKGDKELVRLLLSKGADIEAESLYGTPVAYASALGNEDSVQYLLGLGARSEHLSNARFNYLKAKAREAVENKEYSGAIKWCNEAIKLDSTDAEVLSYRSFSWAQLGNGASALSDAQACVELRGDWAEAHLREGEAWRLLQNYFKAAMELSQAFGIDPQNPEILKAFQDVVKLHDSETKKHYLTDRKT